MISYQTRLGTIEISSEYLAKLIGNAVSQCYGVVGMAPCDTKQRVFSIFNKKQEANRGIIIKGDANSISVEVHIIVTYGMNINAIAKSIANKIKFTVSQNIDINIDKVTVKVDGIKE